MDFQNLTVTETINEAPVKIHCISTGMVSVKTKFREAKHKGKRALIDIFLDKEYTEWMPIWVWVIEHPEGIFVIDTGENSRINDKKYFKSIGIFNRFINRSWFHFKVKENEEIGFQLNKIGIEPDKIENIIMTHLHLDHTDGLSHFKNSTVFVNRTEWEKPYGQLRKLFPIWLKPELVDLNDNIFGFKGKFLTQTKDLMAIHTPGHTYGHTSFLMKTDEHFILFAGDVCYYENQILENKLSGANVDMEQARETYAKTRQLCMEKDVIVLPSHDQDATYRLKRKLYLKTDKKATANNKYT